MQVAARTFETSGKRHRGSEVAHACQRAQVSKSMIDNRRRSQKFVRAPIQMITCRLAYINLAEPPKTPLKNQAAPRAAMTLSRPVLNLKVDSPESSW